MNCEFKITIRGPTHNFMNGRVVAKQKFEFESRPGKAKQHLLLPSIQVRRELTDERDELRMWRWGLRSLKSLCMHACIWRATTTPPPASQHNFLAAWHALRI